MQYAFAIVQNILPQLLRRLEPVPQDNVCKHFFHLVRIFYADDAAHLNGIVSVYDVFKLGRINVVSARNNHSLNALFEIDESVLIHAAEVARMQPHMAVRMRAQCVCILFLVVEITYHYGRSAKADFAQFAVRNFIVCADSANLIVCVGIRQADAALTLLIVRR